MTPQFEACFNFTIGMEGALSLDPNDRGNWTSGVIGEGTLKGTKYGISAASYPTVDIAALTPDEAQLIYARDYYTPIEGDAMPPGMALVMFDAAVNSSVQRSIKWLQEALGIAADGIIGPITRAHRAACDPVAVSAEMLARRSAFDGADPQWNLYGLGWSRRFVALARESVR